MHQYNGVISIFILEFARWRWQPCFCGKVAGVGSLVIKTNSKTQNTWTLCWSTSIIRWSRHSWQNNAHLGGEQITTIGFCKLTEFGITRKQLSRPAATLHGVNRSILNCVGTLNVKIKLGNKEHRETVYFCKDLDDICLSNKLVAD